MNLKISKRKARTKDLNYGAPDYDEWLDKSVLSIDEIIYLAQGKDPTNILKSTSYDINTGIITFTPSLIPIKNEIDKTAKKIRDILERAIASRKLELTPDGKYFNLIYVLQHLKKANLTLPNELLTVLQKKIPDHKSEINPVWKADMEKMATDLKKQKKHSETTKKKLAAELSKKYGVTAARIERRTHKTWWEA